MLFLEFDSKFLKYHVADKPRLVDISLNFNESNNESDNNNTLPSITQKKVDTIKNVRAHRKVAKQECKNLQPLNKK